MNRRRKYGTTEQLGEMLVESLEKCSETERAKIHAYLYTEMFKVELPGGGFWKATPREYLRRGEQN